jgi:hypothetical protein
MQALKQGFAPRYNRLNNHRNHLWGRHSPVDCAVGVYLKHRTASCKATEERKGKLPG